MDESSVIFIRCYNMKACLLPVEQQRLGKCDEKSGYTGYMCTECMKGFWRRESKYVNFLFLNIFRRLSMLQVLNIKFTEILVVPGSFCYNLCFDIYYKDFLPKL